MKYGKVVEARFISRPNRFIALCRVDGQTVKVHVKNTGRCRELLLPETEVYLEYSEKATRKTGYSLVTIKKGERLVNIDSQAPNKVVMEGLKTGKITLPGFGEVTLIKPETAYGNSRFDFYVEAGLRKAFVEVKGVTLEQDGVVLFPDAPTERGVKHVEELMAAAGEGYSAYIIFVVQMKDVKYFTPNINTHPEFGQALKEAKRNGVNILAYDCGVTSDGLEIGKRVDVRL